MRKLTKLFLSIVLMPALLLPAFYPGYSTPTAVKSRLTVGDIAGDYITTDPHSNYRFVTISFIGKTSKKNDLEQGAFRGQIGNLPLVGQGIISGDEGYLDNYVNFDFMFLEPQDVTLLMHSRSTMSKGRVSGLLINEAGTSSNGKQVLPIKFRRVSRVEFLEFQRTHR